jgi:hypothetical protein
MRRRLTFARTRILLALVVVLTLALPGSVGADDLVAGGDVIVPEEQVLDLGSRCAGDWTFGEATLAISRQGLATDASTFANGDVVTITRLTVTGDGIGASVLPNSTISLPADWSAKPAGTLSSGRVTSDVWVTNSTTGPFSGVVRYRAAGLNSNGDTINKDTTLTVTAYTRNCGAVDTTPPTITPTVAGALGYGGWYVSDVTVSWSVQDYDSGIASSAGCQTTTLSTDSAGTTLTCTATSAGGTTSRSVTIKRDATAPALDPTVTPNPVLLGGSATTAPGASDGLSGLAASSCGPVDTTSVGPKSVLCTATDNAGNTAEVAADYSVVYNWTGFVQPIEGLPATNVVKAGSAAPLKFSLGGYQGLDVFAAGYPVSATITSSGISAARATVKTITSGNSNLSYDTGTGLYTYIWKTDKAWEGETREMVMKLVDGQEYRARFSFTK